MAPADPVRTHEHRLVAALSFTEIVSWGILYYAFGVLVEPMQAELGWSQGLLGAGFSLALLVSALLAVPVGHWLERRGSRALMTAGSCAGALLVLAWSHVESTPAFFALCLALGFPLASTLYEAAFTTVVAQLGSGRRSDVALLTLTIVAGLASTVFVPLTQWLVVEHGWRSALRILALILALATIPPHALLLPRRAPTRALEATPAAPAATLPKRRLRLTAAAFGLATVAGTALGVYLVPLLLEQGLSARAAALSAAMIGVGQVVGRIAFTVLRPRHSLAVWSVALFLPCAIGLLALATHLPPALVAPAVFCFALASGAQTLGRTAWALELFEVRDFARVNAVLGRWSLVGRAGAPFALGAAHDAFGAHGPGLIALAGLCLLGGVCARLAAR